MLTKFRSQSSSGAGGPANQTGSDDQAESGSQADDGAAGSAVRRRWPATVALWGVLALLAAGGVVVWASPVLGLQSVEVHGAAEQQIVNEVTDAVGLADGTPLARINIDAVHDRVLAVGSIATATVERAWPHTLVIDMTERSPLAATRANGHWWLVDATGTLYRQVADPPKGLMPIRLATPGPDDRATLAALRVLSALTPEIRAQVAVIAAPTSYDISLQLVDDRTVIWGSDTDAANKNQVLPAMLQQPGSVYDISDPTLVTVAQG